jgi:hypothetical protein
MKNRSYLFLHHPQRIFHLQIMHLKFFFQIMVIEILFNKKIQKILFSNEFTHTYTHNNNGNNNNNNLCTLLKEIYE